MRGKFPRTTHPISFVDPLGLCDDPNDPYAKFGIFGPGLKNLTNPAFDLAIVNTGLAIASGGGTAAFGVAGGGAAVSNGLKAAEAETAVVEETNPQFIFRTGSQTSQQLTDPSGVSFRDSISSEAAGAQTFKPGTNIYAVDTGRLPSGSVVFDGNPPGHVSVNASAGEIQSAIVNQGPGNPLSSFGLKEMENGTSYKLPTKP